MSDAESEETPEAIDLSACWFLVGWLYGFSTSERCFEEDRGFCQAASVQLRLLAQKHGESLSR